MSSTEFSPVFIVGFPRSGTTLLATHLDRHSRIAVPPETQFFLGVLPCGMPSKKKASHDTLVEKLFANWRVGDLKLDREDVSGRFREYEPEYKNLLRATLESYTAREGKSRPGEKSPRHLLYVPLIMEWYPAAKVICIVRDGRDAVQSLMKVPWMRRNLAEFCAEWNYRSNLTKIYREKYPDSFYVIRFEDFVKAPETELSKICSFISEEFEPDQLNTEVKSRIVTTREGAWKNKAITSIDPSRSGAWERTATNNHILLMNNIMGSWLEYWGYSVTTSKSVNTWCKFKIKIQAALYSERLFKVKRFAFNGLKLILCRIGLKKMLYDPKKYSRKG